MAELINSIVSTDYTVADSKTVVNAAGYGIADPINYNINSSVGRIKNTIDSGLLLNTVSMKKTDSVILFRKVDSIVNCDVTVESVKSNNHAIDNLILSIKADDIKPVDTSIGFNYVNILPYLDNTQGEFYRSVDVQGVKPKPTGDVTYLPTSDFSITDELMGFTADFIKPIDYDKLRTPLSPVDSSSSKPWGRPQFIDNMTPLTYGYSINNFLVGGVTDTNYPIDEGAILPPFEPVTGEVISIVNIVNVVTLPDRIPLEFTNFTLALDLDSVAWVASFDLADVQSLNLIKPEGMTVKTVEVDINGEIFNIFIGRTSTSLSTDDKGTIIRRIKCSGWSTTKLLSFPYHAKRSHVENSSSTPSGLLNGELSGTGFTGVWDSVNWTLPAKTFSYFDKAPLSAIADLVNAVGGVIIPDEASKSFTVKPRYPVSPWNWSNATPDYQLGESQFFTIDTEWIPQESPDSIFVYGEENGAAVKCVKQGTAGLITLPTIVDKHITDTVAGTERGRIEVAKAGFKEIIPVTTYIDGNGIIKPQSLIEVTGLDNNIWFGMVVSTSLSISRNGNAIVQSLQIERHYD